MGFLDSAGLNAPSAKFPRIGTKVGGEVVEVLPERQAMEYRSDRTAPQKPKTFPNGDPVMEYPVIIQLAEFQKVRETDTGRRGFYAQKSSGLYKAIVQACRNARKEVGPGDYLDVEFIAEIPGKGSVPKKAYAATLYPAGTWEHLFPKGGGTPTGGGGFLDGDIDDEDDDDRELVGAAAAPSPAVPRARPRARTAATPPSAGGAI